MSTTKTILFNAQSRERLINGANLLADAVRVTMGAGGRNVIIGSDFPGSPPKITKDGITVARAVVVDGYIESMGASVVREASQKTASDVGDATTATIVIASAIMNKGAEMISSPEVNVVEMKAGIDMAVRRCVEIIRQVAIPADDKLLEQVATISANGDAEIGKLISDTVRKIGRNGLVSVVNSTAPETSIEILDGMEIQRGMLSPYFINDLHRTACKLENAHVLVADYEIRSYEEISGILNQVVAWNKKQGIARPLLILAKDVLGDARATLLVNRQKGHLSSCAVGLPGSGEGAGEIIDDIAILCGATVIREQEGLYVKDASITHLGSLRMARAEKGKTLLVGVPENKDNVAQRVLQIQAQLTIAKDIDKERLHTRIAMLTNGVATLSIGGATELETGERRDRIDDAICATRSAMDEGVVAGGGTTYLYCHKKLDELKGANSHQQQGIEIVKYALLAPWLQIMTNAGLSTADPEHTYGLGVDVKTGKTCHLIESGIVDPAKAARVALENAASVAGIFLTTECCISESYQKAEK